MVGPPVKRRLNGTVRVRTGRRQAQLTRRQKRTLGIAHDADPAVVPGIRHGARKTPQRPVPGPLYVLDVIRNLAPDRCTANVIHQGRNRQTATSPPGQRVAFPHVHRVQVRQGQLQLGIRRFAGTAHKLHFRQAAKEAGLLRLVLLDRINALRRPGPHEAVNVRLHVTHVTNITRGNHPGARAPRADSRHVDLWRTGGRVLKRRFRHDHERSHVHPVRTGSRTSKQPHPTAPAQPGIGQIAQPIIAPIVVHDRDVAERLRLVAFHPETARAGKRQAVRRNLGKARRRGMKVKHRRPGTPVVRIARRVMNGQPVIRRTRRPLRDLAGKLVPRPSSHRQVVHFHPAFAVGRQIEAKSFIHLPRTVELVLQRFQRVEKIPPPGRPEQRLVTPSQRPALDFRLVYQGPQRSVRVCVCRRVNRQEEGKVLISVFGILRRKELDQVRIRPFQITPFRQRTLTVRLHLGDLTVQKPFPVPGRQRCDRCLNRRNPRIARIRKTDLLLQQQIPHRRQSLLQFRQGHPAIRTLYPSPNFRHHHFIAAVNPALGRHNDLTLVRKTTYEQRLLRPVEIPIAKRIVHLGPHFSQLVSQVPGFDRLHAQHVVHTRAGSDGPQIVDRYHLTGEFVHHRFVSGPEIRHRQSIYTFRQLCQLKLQPARLHSRSWSPAPPDEHRHHALIGNLDTRHHRPARLLAILHGKPAGGGTAKYCQHRNQKHDRPHPTTHRLISFIAAKTSPTD